MRERPILFSGPMVRVILAGNKTQTRRTKALEYFSQPENDPNGWWCARVSDGVAYMVYKQSPHERAVQCPYGRAGDRLWVRESYRFAASLDRLSPNDVGEKALDAGYSRPWAPTQFEADGRRTGSWRGFDTPPAVTTPGKLRPGIHMPRWACRLVLEITGVRVERLQDINENDAIAEGIERMPCGVPDTRLWRNYTPGNGWTPSLAIPQNSFRTLWESINGEASWDANPWMWAVEFRRIR